MRVQILEASVKSRRYPNWLRSPQALATEASLESTSLAVVRSRGTKWEGAEEVYLINAMDLLRNLISFCVESLSTGESNLVAGQRYGRIFTPTY